MAAARKPWPTGPADLPARIKLPDDDRHHLVRDSGAWNRDPGPTKRTRGVRFANKAMADRVAVKLGELAKTHIEITPDILGSGSYGSVYAVKDLFHLRPLVLKLEALDSTKTRSEQRGEYYKYVELDLVTPPPTRETVVGATQLFESPRMFKFREDKGLDHLALGVCVTFLQADNGVAYFTDRDYSTPKPLRHCDVLLLRAFQTNAHSHFRDIVRNNLEPAFMEWEMRRFVGQLTWAVAYLQERGYCHSDFKPGNVCVNPLTGKFYLVDFGLVTTIPDPTERWLSKTELKAKGKHACGGYEYSSIRNKRGQLSTPASEIETIAFHTLGFLFSGGDRTDNWFHDALVNESFPSVVGRLQRQEIVEKLGTSSYDNPSSLGAAILGIGACLRAIVGKNLDPRWIIGGRCAIEFEWLIDIIGMCQRTYGLKSTFANAPPYSTIHDVALPPPAPTAILYSH